MDSEAGEGVCRRSVCTVLPGISDSIRGVGQLDLREAIGVVVRFSEPVAILIHCIGDSGARAGRSVVVLKEPHNARGVVDNNLVGTPDDLSDFYLVVEKGGEVYLVVGGHPIDLRCRLPQFLATWPVFPLMNQISRPVHDSDGHDLVFNGVGPRRSEVKADDLRGMRLEIACHHAVTPTLHPRGDSEGASDELDFICRSGHANLCHEPLLSHAGELISCVSTLAQRRLGQFGTVGASALIKSGRTYVVRLCTCRLPAVFRVTICHPLAPNGPSRTRLREQNLSQGREVRPIMSTGTKDSNPQTERSASWILQP